MSRSVQNFGAKPAGLIRRAFGTGETLKTLVGASPERYGVPALITSSVACVTGRIKVKGLSKRQCG